MANKEIIRFAKCCYRCQHFEPIKGHIGEGACNHTPYNTMEGFDKVEYYYVDYFRVCDNFTPLKEIDKLGMETDYTVLYVNK